MKTRPASNKPSYIFWIKGHKFTHLKISALSKVLQEEMKARKRRGCGCGIEGRWGYLSIDKFSDVVKGVRQAAGVTLKTGN